MSTQIRVRAPMMIKDGRFDEFREACAALTAAVKEKDPGTVGYAAFVNEATGEGVFIEHYESSEAMLAHFENAGPLFPPLFDICEILPTEVYGDLTPEARAAMESFDTAPVFFPTIVASED
jgi:quinol monooxygenase YgiN